MRTSAVVLGVSVPMLLAACTSQIAGTASGHPSPATSPVQQPVAAPRELDLSQICMLLTDDQQRVLGLTEPGSSRMLPTRDPQCEWRTPQARVRFVHAANGFSIDDIPPVPGEDVTPTEIDGHRAFMFSDVGCNLYVELSPTSYLQADAVALPEGDVVVDECELARSAAAYAVDNFPPPAPR